MFCLFICGVVKKEFLGFVIVFFIQKNYFDIMPYFSAKMCPSLVRIIGYYRKSCGTIYSVFADCLPDRSILTKKITL